MRKIPLNKKMVCQWLYLFVTIIFTVFACWVDLRVGLFFAVYELVRTIYLQIQAEEKLIKELDREQQN
jgi:hypothetical protein